LRRSLNSWPNLTSIADDGYAIVWDLECGTAIQQLSLPFHGPVCTVIWTPFNTDFATAAFALGSADGSVQLYRRNHQDKVCPDLWGATLLSCSFIDQLRLCLLDPGSRYRAGRNGVRSSSQTTCNCWQRMSQSVGHGCKWYANIIILNPWTKLQMFHSSSYTQRWRTGKTIHREKRRIL
jgi:WD40 repeat protein